MLHLNEDSDIAKGIRQLGKGMGILGLIGAAAGLGLAAASGPIVMWAVAAEISIDVTLGVAGFAANALGERIAKVVSRFEHVSNIIGKKRDENLGKTVSKLALITAPLELISGFAIAESLKPMAVAAIAVTALPCAATAMWGLMRERANSKKAREVSADQPEDRCRSRLLVRFENRIRILDEGALSLGRSVKNAMRKGRSEKIRGS